MINKLNSKETQMYVEHNGNINQLKSTLEMNIKFFKDKGQFRKLEETQNFLLKL